MNPQFVFTENKVHVPQGVEISEALDIYKRFLVRMDKVSEFLKVAEVSSVQGKTSSFLF